MTPVKSGTVNHKKLVDAATDNLNFYTILMACSDRLTTNGISTNEVNSVAVAAKKLSVLVNRLCPGAPVKGKSRARGLGPASEPREQVRDTTVQTLRYD